MRSVKEILANISIHAPLRERLYAVEFISNGIKNFNPRSLAGATVQGSNES